MRDAPYLNQVVNVTRREEDGVFRDRGTIEVRQDGSIFYLASDAKALVAIGDRFVRDAAQYEIVHFYGDRPGGFLRVATEPIPVEPARDTPLDQHGLLLVIDARLEAYDNVGPSRETSVMEDALYAALKAAREFITRKPELLTSDPTVYLADDLRAGTYRIRADSLNAYTAYGYPAGGTILPPVQVKNDLPSDEKLSSIVKRAATEGHGGYPDESLLKLAKALKKEGR